MISICDELAGYLICLFSRSVFVDFCMEFHVFGCRAVVFHASLGWLKPWCVSEKIAIPGAFRVLVSLNSFAYQGMACSCSPPCFVSLLVTLLCYLAVHYCYSHCHVGVSYALRVSPVVTRLTVYRRPQVTRRATSVLVDSDS